MAKTETRSFELHLTDIQDLFKEPDVDFFQDQMHYESGVEYVVNSLTAEWFLPERVALSIHLPANKITPDLTTRTSQALVRFCRYQAGVSGREAWTIRMGGRRQLPIALLVAAISVFAAYGSAYFLSAALGQPWLLALLLTIMMVGILLAWVCGWLPIEAILFDWREAGHRAKAYDLLADATVTIVPETA